MRQSPVQEITWEGTHHPIYPDSVWTLMQYITSSLWCNPNYPTAEKQSMSMRLESASIRDVQFMLTSIAHAERFCTGAWKFSIESGELKSIIDKAVELFHRNEL